MKPVLLQSEKRTTFKMPKERLLFWSGFLLTIMCVGIYAFFHYDKTMMISEGWYTEYAQLINNGKVIYKDFECLFFPLYVYIVAGITKVFGYSLIVLRVFGVLVFIGIGIASYLIFSKVFRPGFAVFGACATTFFVQSEIVQIFYDYIRVFDLFIYLAIYFLVCFVEKSLQENKRIFSVQALLLGVFGSAACMIKQSTGVLFLVFCGIFFLFFALITPKKKKYILVNFLVYIGSVAMMFGAMLLLLWMGGALDAFFALTVGNAVGAKGGVFVVLFRWWGSIGPLIFNSRWALISLLLALFSAYLLVQRGAQNKINEEKRSPLWLLITVVIFGFALLAGVVLEYFIPSLSGHLIQYFPMNGTSTFFFSSTILFIAMAFYFLYTRFFGPKKENSVFSLKLFALTGAVFTIGYGVGMSAGLAESQVALGAGVIVMLLFTAGTKVKEKKYRFAYVSVAIVTSMVISLTSTARKYVEPYSWWGLNTDTIWAQEYETEIPLLKGIKTTKNEAEVWDTIYKLVKENTREDATMFAFPHISIFNTLCDRKPITYTQVQWFDVSSMQGIKQDMQTLKENPPNIIVFCRVPLGVKQSHESMFNGGKSSQLRIMNDFLEKLLVEEHYSHEYTTVYDNGYGLSLYFRDAK